MPILAFLIGPYLQSRVVLPKIIENMIYALLLLILYLNILLYVWLEIDTPPISQN